MMLDVIKYNDLSKGDKRRFKALANALNVPFTFAPKQDVKARLREGHEFSNTTVVHHKGKLIFVENEDVVTIAHDLGHALFLGPLYQKLKNGVSDLADVRWSALEESPVMFLQCAIADASLYDFGGGKAMAEQMEHFGYGFGAGVGTAMDWYDNERCKNDYKHKHLKQYKQLEIEANWKKVIATKS